MPETKIEFREHIGRLLYENRIADFNYKPAGPAYRWDDLPDFAREGYRKDAESVVSEVLRDVVKQFWAEARQGNLNAVNAAGVIAQYTAERGIDLNAREEAWI